MAEFYLSLGDHAVAEVIDGFAAFGRLQGMTAEKRTAQMMSKVIIGIHLGIDKSVKAGLADIDPSLLIKSMSGEVVQRLHRERRLQDLPTILAVPGKDETHHLVGLLHVAKGIFGSTLDERTYDEFLGHVQDLVNVRNQLVHKEFVGDYDHVATIIMQVMSRYPAVMSILAPNVLKAAFHEDDQLESRLRALALEVDAAWQVLYDYLDEGNDLSIPLKMWITISPDSPVAELSIGGATLTANGLSASVEVERSGDDPVLLRALPIPPPLQGLLGGQVSSFHNALAPSFLGALSLPRAKTEENTIVPRHSDALHITDVPARISLSLPQRKKSSLAVNARIRGLEIAFQAGIREGYLHATLEAPTNSADTAQALELSGPVTIDAELAVSEGSEHFVAGTTLRKLVSVSRLASQRAK